MLRHIALLHPLTHALRAAIAMSAVVTLLGQPARAQERVIPLASLNGQNGFRLDGVLMDERSGGEVSSAGDLNGDGRDDLAIGAIFANTNGLNSGSTYVVFGRSGAAPFAPTIELSTLNGDDGLRLDGADYSRSGCGVSSAGDINGDGLDDLIVGAYWGEASLIHSGVSYVVFGRMGASAFAPAVNLDSLDGSNGFRIDGQGFNHFSGFSVSGVGDVNGDALDDLVVSATGASPNGTNSGSSYVVFGRSGAAAFPSSINLGDLNGSTGFRLDGVSAHDRSGLAVSAAGDINGDGMADLIIGAPYAASADYSTTGNGYVVFGRQAAVPFPPVINLSTLDGSNGFRVIGVTHNDRAGRAVSAAGDINGDGVDDLIIGAFGVGDNFTYFGSSYVLFGRTGVGAFGASVNLSALDGSNGFRIDGAAAHDRAGRAVSAAGDVNGDGLDDVIVGAYHADASGPDAGSSYVVFGRSGPGAFLPVVSLGTLKGSEGVRVDGVNANDSSGVAVSGNFDINSDGLSDLLIGANRAGPNGTASAGSSYVVYGNAAPLRDGPSEYILPPILEDTAAVSGYRVRNLVGGVYLDAQPLTGVAIDSSPNMATGAWRYAMTGTPGAAVPAGLTAMNALILGASSSGPDAGQLGFAPSPDFFGDSAPIMLRMWDGTGRAPDPVNLVFGSGQNVSPVVNSIGGFSNDANLVRVIQPVLPVNDAPSFSASDPPSVINTSGVVQFYGWASFAPGPSNESDQLAVAYIVSAVSNPSLFAAGFAPRVISKGGSGTLQFAPASTTTSGTSTFSVRVRDTGGTANGGVDLSPAQTFTITITPSTPLVFLDGFE